MKPEQMLDEALYFEETRLKEKIKVLAARRLKMPPSIFRGRDNFLEIELRDVLAEIERRTIKAGVKFEAQHQKRPA